jgi:hypothetical protein
MLFAHQIFVFKVASWSRPSRLIRKHSFRFFEHRGLQLDCWNASLIVELVGCWARPLTIDKLGLVFVEVLRYVLLSSNLTREYIT